MCLGLNANELLVKNRYQQYQARCCPQPLLTDVGFRLSPTVFSIVNYGFAVGNLVWLLSLIYVGIFCGKRPIQLELALMLRIIICLMQKIIDF